MAIPQCASDAVGKRVPEWWSAVVDAVVWVGRGVQESVVSQTRMQTRRDQPASRVPCLRLTAIIKYAVVRFPTCAFDHAANPFPHTTGLLSSIDRLIKMGTGVESRLNAPVPYRRSYRGSWSRPVLRTSRIRPLIVCGEEIRRLEALRHRQRCRCRLAERRRAALLVRTCRSLRPAVFRFPKCECARRAGQYAFARQSLRFAG